MAPVPKKATAAMYFTNARGALCANAPAKLVGKVLREECIPVLEKAVRGHHLGSMRGGGTDLAAAAVRAVFEYGRQLCVPVAVVFADLKAAFYTVLT